MYIYKACVLLCKKIKNMNTLSHKTNDSRPFGEAYLEFGDTISNRNKDRPSVIFIALLDACRQASTEFADVFGNVLPKPLRAEMDEPGSQPNITLFIPTDDSILDFIDKFIKQISPLLGIGFELQHFGNILLSISNKVKARKQDKKAFFDLFKKLSLQKNTLWQPARELLRMFINNHVIVEEFEPVLNEEKKFNTINYYRMKKLFLEFENLKKKKNLKTEETLGGIIQAFEISEFHNELENSNYGSFITAKIQSGGTKSSDDTILSSEKVLKVSTPALTEPATVLYTKKVKNGYICSIDQVLAPNFAPLGTLITYHDLPLEKPASELENIDVEKKMTEPKKLHKIRTDLRIGEFIKRDPDDLPKHLKEANILLYNVDFFAHLLDLCTNPETRQNVKDIFGDVLPKELVEEMNAPQSAEAPLMTLFMPTNDAVFAYFEKHFQMVDMTGTLWMSMKKVFYDFLRALNIDDADTTRLKKRDLLDKLLNKYEVIPTTFWQPARELLRVVINNHVIPNVDIANSTLKRFNSVNFRRMTDILELFKALDNDDDEHLKNFLQPFEFSGFDSFIASDKETYGSCIEVSDDRGDVRSYGMNNKWATIEHEFICTNGTIYVVNHVLAPLFSPVAIYATFYSNPVSDSMGMVAHPLPISNEDNKGKTEESDEIEENNS